ncbi:MAG TPA: hypothetical protein PLV21_16535 [Cyclobacteriaceae bacterium]|nr:hypothetical protein [Cyclobacteriaceae bacterium]HRJ83492.1 hypothetical protein [Cyclobacteriaceae bacterium]
MNLTTVAFLTLVIFVTQIPICKGNEFVVDSLPRKTMKTITLSKNSLSKTGVLPSQVNEASGLALADQQNFWTHNDDGIPVLYCIDRTGKLIRTLYLNNVNKGWEDLARDKEGNLFIGAFGNNKNDRKDLKILLVKNPESISEKIYTAEIINFTYEDQKEYPPTAGNRNFDADALIAFKDSLYIFTKNRTLPFTGFTKVYRLPKTPGHHIAELIDSVYIGKGPMMDDWITGADISQDGTTLALLGHSRIWLIRDFQNSRFSTGSVLRIELGNYSHKAGVTFTSFHELYIVDEKEFGILGGDLYKLDISQFRE